MKRYSLLPLLAVSVLALNACSDKKDNPPPQDTPVVVKPAIQEQKREQTKIHMQLPDFTQLVEEVGASVVNIQAHRENAGNSSLNDMFGFGFGDDEIDPFFDFFRRFQPDEKEDAVDNGSGFIISHDGYILTNAHVVKDADSVKVMLTDKRVYAAKIIGTDTATDTALLKIEAQNLPAVKIGNPKDLRVGEWVAAIGSPFGFENTVTSGIVSAKKRALSGENYIPFIQTDVAINPGNSGGPLFNLYGEVVGMNSQIYTRSGGFMGISFSVPIDVAIGVSEQLKKTGTVKRGQLGIIIQEVSYDLATAFGLDRPRGALVTKILPDSPAIKTDLKAGDIILAVNGEVVEVSSDLPLIIGPTPPNSVVKLSVWRKGTTFEVETTVSELGSSSTQTAEKPQRGYVVPNDQSSFTLPEIGLTLAPLDKVSATRYQLENGGLMVVKAEKLAKKSGLQHGDVIVSVGQNAVSDENSFKNAIAGYNNIAPLYIMRGKQSLYLPLALK